MHQRNDLVDIKVWLGYDHVHTVDPVGKSGGLAVFWKNTGLVDIVSSDKNLVDINVQLSDKKFSFSCIYGEPCVDKRRWFWEKMSRIGVSRKNPWCLLGDFNAICGNNEKIGGPMRSDDFFTDFNNMLSVCRMKELTSHGDPFTWGGRRGNQWIWCKLDRCFGNKEWLNLFPNANQVFLEKRGSDHRPVLVNLLSFDEKRKGRFRFDKSLLRIPNIKSVVDKAWIGRRSYSNYKVSDRIKRCRQELCLWKKNFDLNARDKIIRLQGQLEAEESSNFPCRSRVLSLKHELMEANREEESFWSQRSKDKWLRCGDSNSKKFHESVKMDRGRNNVYVLEDKNGMEYRSKNSKGEIASSYFQDLFSSSNPNDFRSIFHDFTPRVTDQMNCDLLSSVIYEEIRDAVFSIRKSSAPGPDGMNALFFQRFWGDTGDHRYQWK